MPVTQQEQGQQEKQEQQQKTDCKLIHKVIRDVTDSKHQNILRVSDDNHLVADTVEPAVALFTQCSVNNFVIYSKRGGGAYKPEKCLVTTSPYGRVFVGNTLRLNEETEKYEKVNTNQPDIRIHVININKYHSRRLANPEEKDSIMNMISILQYMLRFQRHPNIANLVECMRDDTFMYIVTEFGGEDLYNVITLAEPHRFSQYSERQRREMFIQIVNGMEYLQTVGVYHRDLTVENIVYNATTGLVKIVDFGTAVILPRMKLSQINDELESRSLQSVNPYTEKYPSTENDPDPMIALDIENRDLCAKLTSMSPEVIAKKPLNGFAADMWSLGVILFFILVGGPPWRVALPSDPHFQKFVVQDKMIATLSVTSLSDEAKSLLRTMLTSVNPANRLTIEALRAQAWMTKDL
jgi:serine/threonine protein kinase